MSYLYFPVSDYLGNLWIWFLFYIVIFYATDLFTK